MIVVHVTSTEFNTRLGKRHWMLFETEAGSIKEIVERLNSGEMLYGHALYVHPDADGSGDRVIRDSREITVTRDEVHRIEAPRWKIVRYADETVDEGSPS